MTKKIVDLLTYKIEKNLKENGFEFKKDNKENIKVLIKINQND